MPMTYGTGGATSSIGNQLQDFYFQKKALIEVKKEQFFSQLADTMSMPKNFGKTIKRYHYLPLLDDANINDQGIDAAGLSVVKSVSLRVTMADGSIPDIPPYFGVSRDNAVYFVGEGATAALAADAAILAFNTFCGASILGGGLGLTLVGVSEDLKYVDAMNVADGLAYVKGFRIVGHPDTTTIDALAVAESGNLYGSSKDIGTISGKLPALTENGGRVNRVGFKRIELEGTLDKFGFFSDYTEESLNFDSDSDLEMHINREMIYGANEMTEDALQIDLLNGAGVIRYAGTATTRAGMSGVAATLTEVTYDDLMRLEIDLDNNRCPKHTKIITGSRMTDTKVINAARVMYIGSEMVPTFRKMKDHFDNAAFIPLANYSDAAGSGINGEIGAVGGFRLVVVPEMLHHKGSVANAVGIAEGVNAGYRTTDERYDAYPLLVVGSECFTTIGFQTSGKSVKFKIYHKKPGEAVADKDDPYGEKGFMSIKWYYGFMMLRPERLAVLWTVARW